MQPQGRGLGALRQHRLQPRLFRFQLAHLLLHRGVIHTIFDGLEDAGDLGLDPGERGRCLLPVLCRLGRRCIEGFAILFRKMLEQIWGEKPVL